MFSKLVWFVLCVLVGVLVSHAQSKTDSDDVSALNVMYTSLNSPQTLDWKSSGGDPCGDDWKGITCSGSSVTEINLSGLKLTGSLGYQLSSLSSVTYFDVSNNDVKGGIPFQLPPNVVRLDLSGNGFTGNVPYSVSQMTDLKYLNLGHNQLSGQLTDMFRQLRKLDTLDLSHNTLTGNLPQSFGSLSSLSTLYLQNNQFTGPIDSLAKLKKLDDLNLAHNHFSGWIPHELTKVNKINIEGNSWSSGPAPPGTTPSDEVSPSGHSSTGGIGGFGGAVIVVVVLGFLLGILVVIALVARRRTIFSSSFLDESIGQHKSLNSYSSHRFSDASRANSCKEFEDVKPLDSYTSIDISALQSSHSTDLTPAYSDRVNCYRNNELVNMNVQRSKSVKAVTYALADLQHATNNFATGRLLGEGSIGRVYKAKYSDGKVVAVKKISSTYFHDQSSGTFSEIVTCLSRLHHPNIAPLLGYCSEQGHNILVYEYFRNGSLHEFLHLSDEFSKPLTWNTRVKIALGTAKAIEYLHDVCSPPLTHMSIKSSNIVLDIELNPCLLECGLATLLKRAERNIGAGYNPPECTKVSAHTFKSDVYSFGVVMLELLTGRMPFDNSMPRSEQYLVQWAIPQLHVIDALEKMVDPALRGLYPPKSISRFADIVALCVEAKPELRPPMSEVVQSLVRLLHGSSMNRRGDDLSASRRIDDYVY